MLKKTIILYITSVSVYECNRREVGGGQAGEGGGGRGGGRREREGLA